jgi:DNA ligase-1
MPPVVVRRKPIQVQLAKVYEGGGFIKPMWAEPKLDGLRGVLIVDGDEGKALTRTGMDVPNANHILEELLDSGEFQGMVLDVEFLATNWNDSQSIVKTQSVHPLAETLKAHAFDLLSVSEWKLSQCYRALELRKFDLMRRLDNFEFEKTVYVDHKIVSTEADAKQHMSEMVKAGYEGIMLKDPDGNYVFKKTNLWLKYKPFFEADFTIEGAVEGRGKHEGKLGALKIVGFVNDRLIKSEVGTGFDDDQRKTLWHDYESERLLGRIVEVEYQEITEDGKLRFPAFRRVRDDK